jgi:DNA-binding transcriptional ArsR family regulator
MFKALFGSERKGKILLFLHAHGESYPSEIARAFGYYLNSVQTVMANLERGGILYSRLRGNLRLFGLNPRYPFKRELEALMEKSLMFVAPEEKEKLYTPRLRPRQTGKPL